ncbi:MAG: class F sortase [Nocardioides sp.]|uniref:class F sortase n=1 Tax=Nocardioides sp. TaxID=35761 RepID=UPI003D6AFA2E
MTEGRTAHGGHRGRLALLALVAAVAGAILVVVAVVSQDPAPPSLDEPVGTLESSPPASSNGPPQVRPAKEVPLGPSKPVSISIPAIGVRSSVFPLGKTDDGRLAVPQPGPNLDKAAWFENSPTPGQPGPSIIEGHVATEERGPSIFFDLAELRPGDTISVRRADGRTAVFTVDALREFPKDEFPTKLIYGGDLGEPTLRLITCSNFDPSVGSHTGNLIAFSRLTSVVES